MLSTNSKAGAGRRPALWALVDCNNFYVSCERLFRPDLHTKPVVVLSNNDGCIISRSNEAKKLGFGMAEPEFKVREALRRHKVAVFSSNYALYGDISQRVMDTLAQTAPVEVYSIDEAFMPLGGALAAQAQAVAHSLRQRVLRWVGVTVSVGIGPTRTLAKLANYLAKREGCAGVFSLDADAATREAVLAEVPCAAVWGIGRKNSEKLRRYGLKSALDLVRADEAWVRKTLSITGLRTQLELRGIPCLAEGMGPTTRHTLVSSRSFGARVDTREALEQALGLFTARAGERLRREGLAAGGLGISVTPYRRYAPGEARPASLHAHVPLHPPTDDTRRLVKAAHAALERLYEPGFSYTKAGVMLTELVPLAQCQHFLPGSLPEAEAPGSAALMRALDAVNARYGKQRLHFGAQGGKDEDWHMRMRHRSPRMTSHWDELASARCD